MTLNCQEQKIKALEDHIVHLEMEQRRLTLVEKTLRVNEIKLLEIQRIASIGTWEMDLLSNRFLCSKECAQILGSSTTLLRCHDDLVGHIYPDEREEFLTTYQRAIDDRHSLGMTHRMVTDDGAIKFVHHFCKVFYSTGGIPLRTVGLIQDVSLLPTTAVLLQQEVADHRIAWELLLRHQQQLETLNRELEVRVTEEVRMSRAKDQMLIQSYKMASLGQLVAGIAHEINNPVGYISSNLDVLADYFQQILQYDRIGQEVGGGEPTSSLREDIVTSRRSLKIESILEDGPALIKESLEGTGQVKKIILNLKNFCRTDTQKGETVTLSSCLENALIIAHNELKYVATIRKEYESGEALLCHPGQLSQVFLNLLVNAGQAIAPGQGDIVLRSWHDDSFEYASVSDTGEGIPKELQCRIFEPFFTTKEKGKGTGLGLSISTDIVTRHLGTMSVESELGRGTTFTVKLPHTTEE